jgi:hypothetical protein
MPSLVLLGDRSLIAQGLSKYLEQDGWNVTGWHRHQDLPPMPWDAILCAIGSVSPVGLWEHETDERWAQGISDNLLVPLGLIRSLWPLRNESPQVCMLAGSNPNTIMSGYSAYNVGKMALLKAVEQLNEETDAKWFALGPGIVLSKIHRETLDKNWANPRLREALRSGGMAMERIYECLKWCFEQPKEVIGGRNICASDNYRKKIFAFDTWKLRRHEG